MNTKSRVEIMWTNFSASRMLRMDTPRPLYTAWAYADRVTMRTGTETKSSISLHVHMTDSQVCVGMGIPMGGMRIEIPSPRQPCQFAELFALACSLYPADGSNLQQVVDDDVTHAVLYTTRELHRGSQPLDVCHRVSS